MPGGFVKLYGSILDSSIWSEDPFTRLVWITMLAMADADGHIEAAVPGLARRANVPVEACEAALQRLAAPDPYSKSPEHEGRRIETIPRGWLILNYAAYRELRTDAQVREAARVKAYRDRTRTVRTAKYGKDLPSVICKRTEGVQGEETAAAAAVAREREAERAEVAACRATCAELTALTGKPLDEILYDHSEFNGRRLVRLETASPKWLKITHDKIRAAVIEAKRNRGDGERPKGEDPLARIRRGEAERAERLRREGGAA